MYTYIFILLISCAITLPLHAGATYLAARTLRYTQLSYKHLLLVSTAMLLGAGAVQTITYFLLGEISAYLVGITTSVLIFNHLYKKRYGGTNWRIAGVWMVQHAYFLVAALVLVIAVRGLFVQPFVMSGQSMSPTYSAGDYLLIERVSTKHERGDIVVHKYPQDRSKVFLKRVIGLPNETVAVQNGVVTITTPEGETFELNEPYVSEQNRTNDNLTMLLGADEYFVLGDNRAASSDSRVWGPIQRSDIVGEVWIRMFEGQ